MRRNYEFKDINDALPILFGELIYHGNVVPSRIEPTFELAFTGITLEKPLNRELLIKDRNHNLAAQIAETMWVLAGRNDIEWLSNYLPRAADFSDDGKTWRAGYGPRLRMFGDSDLYEPVDQLEYVVDLLRKSPETRQAVMTIWDPRVDTTPGKDIACNNWLHFMARDRVLDLHVTIRSNDAMWGWSGINAFEWSVLLEMVAGMTAMDVGALHFSVSSFHLYEKHWAKAQQIANDSNVRIRGTKESPRFNALGLDDMDAFHEMCHQWFEVEHWIRTEAASGPLTEVTDNKIEDFPEPMLQSWLRVLAWWWTTNPAYLVPLHGTPLNASAALSVQPKPPTWIAEYGGKTPVPTTSLIEDIVALHNEKDLAYRGSWCKRGEVLGIMANIARKVDRLGGAETTDESSLDTAEDLFVYLAKYLNWSANGGKDDTEGANDTMREIALDYTPTLLSVSRLEEVLRAQFDRLEAVVMHGGVGDKDKIIQEMLDAAWNLVIVKVANQ